MGVLAQADSKELDLEALAYQPKTQQLVTSLQRAKDALAYYLIPSIYSSIRNNKKPLKRTAWLDGLRGYAAFLVFILHHHGWAHPTFDGKSILESGFGFESRYYFICLPWIRLFFSGGHFAVVNFFGISGYVLSLAPLSILHGGDLARFGDNVSSAVFRRWIRLFLPVFATTFLWFTAWHVFGFRSSNGLSDDPTEYYMDEVFKWYHEFRTFSFTYNGLFLNKYNDHMWTIAFEFRGSVIVYMAIVAFSRCPINKRLLLDVGLIYYSLFITDGWYHALFILGMLLCELDILAEKGETPRSLQWTNNMSVWFWVAVMVVGTYLGGVPAATENLMHLRETPGWYYLSFIKPRAMNDYKFIYMFLGTLCNLICIPRIPLLKGFFDSNFCQYLGRLSFGLYLVHGPVLWSIGDRLYAVIGCGGFSQVANMKEWRYLFVLPGWGPLGLEVNYLIGLVILLAITLWFAEVATKLIDEPSLKFSKWLYKQCTTSKEPQKPYVQ